MFIEYTLNSVWQGFIVMRVIWFIVILFLCGCYAPITVPDTFQYEEIQTARFKLASWQKITNNKAPVKFYIEGDGAAFNAHGQPTQNPTPKSKMIRELAFEDASPNVVYLARPCQYVKDSMCSQKYWTTARFAPEVIDSSYEAIKKIAGNRDVVLIGFSGGAQVAGLVSVLHDDLKIKKLITVGGNLDHKSWTSYHHLPALTGSLSLVNYQEKYRTYPQVHYAGEKDNVIPLQLIIGFAGRENTVIVKGASHGSGWEDVYFRIWRE